MAATMACYAGFESAAVGRGAVGAAAPPSQAKDYSKPLHVDCSVEYELPNQARPPGKSEPLLMIHPCFYRRAESQRRSPFINNLPPQQPQQQPARRTTRLQQQQQQQPQPQQRFQPQQTLWDPFAAAQHQMAWPPAIEQQALYCKPPASRRRSSRRKQPPPAPELRPMAPDYANVGSSADSGIGGVLSWTDTSPIVMQAVQQDPSLHMQDDKIAATTAAAAAQENRQSQQQQQPPQPQQLKSNNNQRGYTIRAGDSNNDLAELLAAACGADHLPPLPKVGVAPGKTQIPSQPHQSCGCPSSNSRQQPAVGVTAVACRACRPAPVQQNYWPLAACEPEPAASGRRAWPSRSSGAKRSRVSTPVQWTGGASFVESTPAAPAWPVCLNNINNNNSKDCGVCKVCQDSNQWNNYYCRAEDRVLWNNENMLRLFQV
ncbi:mastermind-like protein 3 [Neocloeon triangulifer]|uniref:mastermind-like protein 3 n=1 Tax=Neocloeon triangulifer TaxID=2078957 RepID=UPI00286F5F5A|nr:mastermind-like protein 3 [Neocloeon triangulifer]